MYVLTPWTTIYVTPVNNHLNMMWKLQVSWKCLEKYNNITDGVSHSFKWVTSLEVVVRC